MSPSGRKALAVLLPLVAAPALHGSGFAIIEQSVSGLGNAYAGGAAVAEDASTLFFNPAGMIRLDSPQINVGGHLLLPSARFRNEGSLTFSSPTDAPVATQGRDSNGGVGALVPNVYYVQPLSQDLVFGVGIHAPFGLVTEYDADWVGRYVGVKSDLMTLNVNPSIAYRLTEQLSVGAGVSVQYADVQLSSAIDLNRDGTTLLDGFADMEADGLAFGGNVGFLYEHDSRTRAGLHYRSAIKHELKGDAVFTLPALPAPLAPAAIIFHNQEVSAEVTLPETLSLSIYRAIGERWALMGDVTWTNWSRFQVLDIDFADPVTESYSGHPIEERWKDTLRYSMGANFQATKVLVLRVGVAYDESPVPSAQLRSPRIPDNDRVWLALGATWAASRRMDISVGYVHIFVDDPGVDNNIHTAGQWLKGTFDAQVDIVSAAATVRF